MPEPDAPSLITAIEQFNQRDFYACHDTLEALWSEAQDPERRFLQGLLQVAVAYYHWGNGNRRGCAILLGEGLRKLVTSLENDWPLDLDPFVEQVEQSLAQVLADQTEIGIPILHLHPREGP
ncbi:MAG: DUF309 domain-containing protein [Synechococcales cyanobacterium]